MLVGRLALLLLLPQLLWAAPTFPELTGRVVDQAGLLSPEAEQALVQRLAGHEQASGNQVVVVTLDSLQGQAIEQFGYQLGRHWGIGQADEDNGVLLIVAPKERKVRIEVGYGLEGRLTDAISHQIIQRQIFPAFKQENYEAGILAGTGAILDALGGDYVAPTQTPRQTADEPGMGWIFFVALGLAQLITIFTRRRWLSGLSASATAFVIAWITAALGSAIVLAVVVFVAHLLLSGRMHWY
ncbi:MAG: TPM domain-containing protein, partial [Gammaproteobacteria bacterium]|nr:TPM domain-containing protein [Gammaproteobacteria bacterium]